MKGKKNNIGYIARALLYEDSPPNTVCAIRQPIGWLHFHSAERSCMGTKHKHRKHPKQEDPFYKLPEVEKERYRQEFIELEQHLYRLCVESMLGQPVLERVDPMEYYRDMFPEGSFETCTWEERIDEAGNVTKVAVTGIDQKPNGMISVINDKEQRGRSYTRIVFDDLEEIKNNMDQEKALISPIGFSGRKRQSKLAYCFFGMTIDLDNVGIDQLNDLIYQMQNGVLPMATYLVHTASGFHVSYLFETPIPAMPQYFESLNRLKHDISEQVWNKYTSRDTKKQFQGIFQGFRMAGTPTKLGEAYRSSVYRLGEKVTIRELNSFADKENRCVFDDIKHISLDEAHELWADWYERRIVEGRPIGDYKLTEKEKIRRRAWYESWKERIKKGAFDGNRHYCIGVLFNYGMKSEIPIEDVLEDALAMVDDLNLLTEKPTNQFTEDDVYAAMVYYDRRYIKMGRDGIMRLTKIDIGETKRNNQKQKDHLEEARAIRDIRMRRQGKDWRNKNGRPIGSGTKQEQIGAWQREHPNGTKAQCIKETGISKPTVYKWWK